MAFQILGLIGADLTRVVTAVNITAGTEAPLFNIGTVALASDGKTYVYAKANATISASTAVCAINASTFLVAASGGAYTSPATALVTGDYAWFSKANV